jgi:predicted amidophosphoribosyltransferase
LFAPWLNKAGSELLANADLIAPVPLYPSRLWWRRFNQSANARVGGRAARRRPGRLLGAETDQE